MDTPQQGSGLPSNRKAFFIVIGILVVLAGIPLFCQFQSTSTSDYLSGQMSTEEQPKYDAAQAKRDAAYLKQKALERDYDWGRSLEIDAYLAAQEFIQRRHRASGGYLDFPVRDYQSAYFGDSLFVVKCYADLYGKSIRYYYECQLKYVGGESTMPGSWKLVDLKKLPPPPADPGK